MATLKALWPTIKPGGIFVMEVRHGPRNMTRSFLLTFPPVTSQLTAYCRRLLQDLIEWMGSPERDPDSFAAPTAPLPLFQRLIHTMNCHSRYMDAFHKDFQAWCRKEQDTVFR